MIIQGKVKIIRNPDDYCKIKSTVVIVARNTTPDIVMVMDKVAGIITEVDNKFCHAAIIAREYDIPLAMGCEKATKRFKNGESVFLRVRHNKII